MVAAGRSGRAARSRRRRARGAMGDGSARRVVGPRRGDAGGRGGRATGRLPPTRVVDRGRARRPSWCSARQRASGQVSADDPVGVTIGVLEGLSGWTRAGVPAESLGELAEPVARAARWLSRRGWRGVDAERRPRARRAVRDAWPLMTLLGQLDAAAALRSTDGPSTDGSAASDPASRLVAIVDSMATETDDGTRPVPGVRRGRRRATTRGLRPADPLGTPVGRAALARPAPSRAVGDRPVGRPAPVRHTDPACAAARRLVDGPGSPG